MLTYTGNSLLCRNSVSVHRHQINLWDRVWGEVEKNSFIALPGSGSHSRLTPPKRCPSLEWVVSFVMVQRGGHDKLMDILLIGWWWESGSQQHQSSGFNQSGVYCWWAAYSSFLLPCGSLCVWKVAQIYCSVCPLSGNSALKAALLFLGCSSLISASPLFPD